MRLYLLCASHLSETARVGALQAVIQCAQVQTAPTPLVLSLSATPDLAKEAASLQDFDGLTVLHQPEQLPQFAHYYLLACWLMDQHDEHEPAALQQTWVAFTDDDDSFGFTRMRWFRDMIAATQAAITPDCPLGSSIVHIVGDQRDGFIEYFDCAVRLDTFVRWFEVVPIPLMTHTLADCFFVQYLRRVVRAEGLKVMDGPGASDCPAEGRAEPQSRYQFRSPCDLELTVRAHRSPKETLDADNEDGMLVRLCSLHYNCMLYASRRGVRETSGNGRSIEGVDLVDDCLEFIAGTDNTASDRRAVVAYLFQHDPVLKLAMHFAAEDLSAAVSRRLPNPAAMSVLSSVNLQMLHTGLRLALPDLSAALTSSA